MADHGARADYSLQPLQLTTIRIRPVIQIVSRLSTLYQNPVAVVLLIKSSSRRCPIISPEVSNVILIAASTQGLQQLGRNVTIQSLIVSQGGSTVK